MEKRVCYKCKVNLTTYKNGTCRKCSNLINQEWRTKNRDKHREYMHKYHQGKRLTCLQHYSGGDPKCACCGESHVEFLGFDHINGGGGKHRRSLTTTIYDWMISNHFPEGFRVLCYNCNQSIGHYGYCPHEAQSQIDNPNKQLIVEP